MTKMHEWETVVDSGPGEVVMRLRVPGGWLYQTSAIWHQRDAKGLAEGSMTIWHPPVFVPYSNTNEDAL